MKKILQIISVCILLPLVITASDYTWFIGFDGARGKVREGLYKGDKVVMCTKTESALATKIKAVRIRLYELLVPLDNEHSKLLPQEIKNFCADKNNGCFIVNYDGIPMGGSGSRLLPQEIYVTGKYAEKSADFILKILKEKFKGKVESVSKLTTYFIKPIYEVTRY